MSFPSNTILNFLWLMSPRMFFSITSLFQWHPESIATNTISPSRPRVYLIDFEVVVEFALECTPSNRVCTSLPIGPGFATERYARRHAPEFASGRPYNPFKLDIWQLGTSLVSQFQVSRICSSSYTGAIYVIYTVLPEGSEPNN